MPRIHRNRRQGATGKRSRAKDASPAAPHYSHSLFGDIPLVPTSFVDADGKMQEYLTYDLDWQPKLPKGAVRGDVRRQQFCPGCHVPRYFYVDAERSCVQCGGPFVFSAREQKYWYETLKFHFDSVAIRCLDCRRRQRTDRALNAQIAAATEQLLTDPDNPTHLLDLAEALVRYHERTGSGSLNRAVEAARRAVRQAKRSSWAGTAEAYFWEASAHRLAGRSRQARELYQRFVASVPNNRRYRQLLAEAKAWLE
jgi:hypothetical protein